MRLMVLFANWLLLISPLSSSALGESSDIFPECNGFQGWRESREQLGGAYFADGWDSGFVNLLQITAVNGSIQGYFISIELQEDGAYENESGPVVGLYDQSQISLNFQGFLGSVTATGTWSPEEVQVTWPDPNGSLSQTVLRPINEQSAALVLDLWPRHTARDINAELSLAMMQRVAAASPFEAMNPERVFADAAAGYTAIPTLDAIDLLLMGWLASAQFSEHAPDSEPNQANWYHIHVFSYADQARQAAGCYQDEYFQGDDTNEDPSFPFESAVVVNTLKANGEVIITTVVAIHGSNLITAEIYGDEAMAEHGLETVRLMIEDIGEIR